MLGSLGSSVVLHWFGHISMMQMVSFNFWFWFGFWSTFQSRNIPVIYLFFQIGHFVLRRRVCWDHWEVVLYFTDLDISLWCRWFLKISGFDSVSGADFSPESIQRFIYFIQIGHFVLRRRKCWHHWEVVLYFTDLDISLWCRWFLSISGFDSVSGAHLRPESVQRFIYSIQIGQTYLYDADGFFQYLILIRFLVSISVPNHSEIHLFYSDWTLCSMRRVWWDHRVVVLYFTDLEISLWCIWFLSISGFNSVSGDQFRPDSV